MWQILTKMKSIYMTWTEQNNYSIARCSAQRAKRERNGSMVGSIGEKCSKSQLQNGAGESTTNITHNRSTIPRQNHPQYLWITKSARASMTLSSVCRIPNKTHSNGFVIKSPISKKTIKQVGIRYINATNLLAGLVDDNGLENITFKSQEGID